MFLSILGLALLLSTNLFAQSYGYGTPYAYTGQNPAAPQEGHDCKEFSLLDPGQSMEKVPPRDQGNTGTCCGFAAAGAIDAWRVSNDPQSVHFLTSPQALSAQAAKSKNTVIRMSNGVAKGLPGCQDIAKVYAVAKKQGICSYDALGANFTKEGLNIDQNSFWIDLRNDYKNWHRAYLSDLEQGDSKAAQSTLAMAQTQLSGSLCGAGFDEDQSQLQNLKNIESFIDANNSIDALDALTKKLCAGHTEPLPKDFPKPVEFSTNMMPAAKRDIASRTQIYDKIFAAMFHFKNKQPVAVAICGGVLTDFSSVGINAISAQPTTACAGHAALVIGQKRLSDGRCGYLIRNSWGTDRDNAALLQLYTLTDNHGDILVPKDALYNNLWSAAVLPPKGERYVPPKNLYNQPTAGGYGGYGGYGAYGSTGVVPTYNPYPPLVPAHPPAPPPGGTK